VQLSASVSRRRSCEAAQCRITLLLFPSRLTLKFPIAASLPAENDARQRAVPEAAEDLAADFRKTRGN
jgi:hypothetical protein